jgi:hypothetical protein
VFRVCLNPPIERSEENMLHLVNMFSEIDLGHAMNNI